MPGFENIKKTVNLSIYSLLRAIDGVRTRDPDLGKVVLYQLSHCRIFSVPLTGTIHTILRTKRNVNTFFYFFIIHGFHFQLELFFYALLFFTKHKNVIDRDIDVSLMIFSTYILPNLRCVNNHYSLFLFFL